MAQFLDSDCRAFQTGPVCCAGSESLVLRCANTGHDTSVGEVYCLPDGEEPGFMYNSVRNTALENILLRDILWG